MIMIPESEMVDALVLPCCGLTVADFYNYCPQCGKKIDREKCQKKKVPYTAIDLFDYATWICSCGKGYERFSHDFCPICGKNRKT